MSFKGMVQNDLRTFIDLETFAELHNIDGQSIAIIVDSEGLSKAQQGTRLAVSESSMMFHAVSEDLKKRKTQGQSISIDGKLYIVDSWDENDGITSVFCSVPETN